MTGNAGRYTQKCSVDAGVDEIIRSLCYFIEMGWHIPLRE
jgi:hypothetical protein